MQERRPRRARQSQAEPRQPRKKVQGSLLDVAVLEQWLNNMLVEACFTEKFETSISQAALKKFGIDRNTLRSKGVGDELISRLMRSLYVYSMGFNGLTEELTLHMGREDRLSTKTTIWSVFSSLLEYCSMGEFNTMLGEKEREKNRMLGHVRAEMARREEFIQHL